MKITKTTTIIQVTREELQQNLYSAFQDILNDRLVDGLEDYEMEVHRLSDCIQTIHRHGFRPLFKDSYTMLLLAYQDFLEVEKFFNSNSADSLNCLEIVVTNKDGAIEERINQDEISY